MEKREIEVFCKKHGFVGSFKDYPGNIPYSYDLTRVASLHWKRKRCSVSCVARVKKKHLGRRKRATKAVGLRQR